MDACVRSNYRYRQFLTIIWVWKALNNGRSPNRNLDPTLMQGSRERVWYIYHTEYFLSSQCIINFLAWQRIKCFHMHTAIVGYIAQCHTIHTYKPYGVNLIGVSVLRNKP